MSFYFNMQGIFCDLLGKKLNLIKDLKNGDTVWSAFMDGSKHIEHKSSLMAGDFPN